MLLNELKKYAFLRRIKNQSYAKLDYVQDVFLFVLYNLWPKLIFKGGTALWKLYKLPRFSEDLDFTYSGTINIENLRREVEFMGFDVSILKEKWTDNLLFAKFVCKSEIGSVKLSVEILKANAPFTSQIFHSPYPNIPEFEVNVLPLIEIAQTKVDAIIHRDKPRDVYDLYFLITRFGIKPVVEDIDKFTNSLDRKEQLWKSLEPLVFQKLPSFTAVKNTILNSI